MPATSNILKNSLLDSIPTKEIGVECLVIGSGAGGALSAQFLAERGREVLILEEGPFIEFENGRCGIADTFPKIWREGGAIPIMSNTSLVFGEGRCLGGSTQLNAGLLNRAPEEIVENWRSEYGVMDLEADAVNKFQNRIEQFLSAHTEDDSKNPMSAVLRRGSGKAGFKGVQIPVASKTTDGNAVKQSMQETFLKDAALHGAKMLVNCRVDKILLRRKMAVGVIATYKGAKEPQKIIINCKYLFISAGAIQSPLLLRRAGIKKNIGNSLQFHPTLRVIAEFDEPILGYAHKMPSFQIKEFSPLITMGASLTSPPYIAAGLALNWENQKRFMARQDNMAIFYVGVKSRSQGITRNMPLINGSYIVRYSLSPEDAKNLAFGYAKLCELLFSSGAKRLFPAITNSGIIENLSQVKKFLSEPLPLKYLNLVTIHSYSSCPMGELENYSALDSYGKLRGFENIYINDASILPTSPGVNPQGPLMAMVLRNLEKNFS